VKGKEQKKKKKKNPERRKFRSVGLLLPNTDKNKVMSVFQADLFSLFWSDHSSKSCLDARKSHTNSSTSLIGEEINTTNDGRPQDRRSVIKQSSPSDNLTDTKIPSQPLIQQQALKDDFSGLDMAKITEIRRSLGSEDDEINNEFTNYDIHRFLISRSDHVGKTVEMLKKRHEWYNRAVGAKWKIDNPALRPRDMGLVATDKKDDMFFDLFPCANRGYDREGSPIYWEKSGFSKFLVHIIGVMSRTFFLPLLSFSFSFFLLFSVVSSGWGNIKKAITHDELTCRHIRVMELLRERCRKSSARLGKRVEQQVIIMDFKGGPMLVEWACLKSLQEVMTIDEAYYPDTIKHMFVINAPSYFSYLFNIIKPWMNPLDVKKIMILGEQKEFLPVLLKYIDENEIPVEYGGNNVEFGWKPPSNRDPLDLDFSASANAVSSTSDGSLLVTGAGQPDGSTSLTDSANAGLNMAKIAEIRRSLGSEDDEINNEFTNYDIHRFLISRSDHVGKTVEMLKKRHEWYNRAVGAKWKIDNPALRPRDMGLVATDKKDDMFFDLFPCANRGYDREGSPIYWEKSGFSKFLVHIIGVMSRTFFLPLLSFSFSFFLLFSVVSSGWGNIKKAITHDELTCRHIRVMELLRERCRKSSARLGKRVEQQVIIMDFKGGPMLVEWACLKSLQEVMTIDEAYYPDTIKHMFVINAPSYFSYLFNIIKPWMNPLDVKKIMILGEQKEFLPVLLKYIDENEIPVEYGGNNVEFGWKPPSNRDPLDLDFPTTALPASSSTALSVSSSSLPSSNSAMNLSGVSTMLAIPPVSLPLSLSDRLTSSQSSVSIIEIQQELKKESFIVSEEEIRTCLLNHDGNVVETIKILKTLNSWYDGM
jgi:hypothetical protein